MEIALIGAGQRGMIYAAYAHQHPDVTITAIVEPNTERREEAGARLGVPSVRQYASTIAFFAAGKLADAAIIASMDRDHYAQAMAALDRGYHLLLEKPISPDPGECLRIERRAKEKDLLVVVCHVLRYAPFFQTLRRVLDSGTLGRIITIQHNENIGNFHMAHSFVRGNWHSSAQSSPIIMQKSCHDMDILNWLTNSEGKRIASFGQLTYFKAENAPAESTERCIDCPVAEGCRFDARKCYLPVRGSWPASMLSVRQGEADILQAIKTGPYGRCVYRCGNDVCDHQVTLIEFANGVTATFNLSAFTNQMGRTLKIMCEHGEIRASELTQQIEIIPFAASSVDAVSAQVITPERIAGAHGGGDVALVGEFLEALHSNTKDLASTIERSVSSHLMCYAAELSRVKGTMVEIEQVRESLLGQSDAH